MNGRILIVEDEAKLAQILADYLVAAGFTVAIDPSGAEVVDRLRRESFALCLLDRMLPGRDGLDLFTAIRRSSTIPVIFVTARVEEIDRLLGLELGADDYICKPFSPREVVARVKAVLRRTQEHPSEPTGLSLDHDAGRALIDGHDLGLTVVEFRLLALLAAAPGRIFSRGQLMDRIYPDERIVSDRTIDSHIKKLRRKMAANAPDRELIHAVYGAGYRFEMPETGAPDHPGPAESTPP